MNKNVTSQLSPSTLIAAIAVVIMALSAMWALSQSQISAIDTSAKERDTQLGNEIIDLKNNITDIHNELRHDVVSQNEFGQFQDRYITSLTRIDRLDAQVTELISKEPHEPVEKATLDVIISGINQREELLTGVQADLNRQLAAVLVAMDARKTSSSPP